MHVAFRENSRTLRQTKTIQPIRVGFLGTGYIADWHAKAIRSISAASLDAVCDKDAVRAQSFCQRHGAGAWYDSLDAMLQECRGKLDVVHVLLPPDLHASAASSLIDQGLHVFLEKPMATTPLDCAELIEKASERNLALGVNHNFLFAPVYERLRDDLSAGRLGQPDHVTITWNRELDQLQSGPFNLWMLRDPRNILLEIGPHCLATMLDLVGPLELDMVRASNPVTLRAGQEFYRRWTIQADSGPVAATVNLSFSPGFTEQLIHVRGSMASATVDFERNTYSLHQHTHYGLDIDRFRMTTREAAVLRSQAWRTLGNYGLSKLKLSTKGSPYGLSITRALKSFYAGLGGPLDRRLSAELGREAVNLCIAIGQQGLGDPAARESVVALQTAPAVAAGGTPAEILILGATGFIGRELARQLIEAGHRIRVLVRNPGKLPDDLLGPEVEIVRGDLARPEDLLRAVHGTRVVYHLARANVKTWEEFVEQDIEVTRSVAEACLAAGVSRFIYTGTIDSYYSVVCAGTITEETPLDPHIAWRISMPVPRPHRKSFSWPCTATGRCRWSSSGRASSSAGVEVRSTGESACGRTTRSASSGGKAVTRSRWSSSRTWPCALVLALDAPKIEGESFNLVAHTDITALDYLRALEDHAGIAIQKFPTPLWKFYATDLAKWVVKKLVKHPDQRKPSYRDWEARTQKARYDCTKARNLLKWKPVCDREEIIRRGIQIPASEILPPSRGCNQNRQADLAGSRPAEHAR